MDTHEREHAADARAAEAERRTAELQAELRRVEQLVERKSWVLPCGTPAAKRFDAVLDLYRQNAPAGFVDWTDEALAAVMLADLHHWCARAEVNASGMIAFARRRHREDQRADAAHLDGTD